ncbi:MAG: SBBP repeat-containing protein, partial [Bacteroidota bacterium]
MFIAPGSNPHAARFRYENVLGLTVDESGRLLVHTASGDVIEEAPRAYQEIGGRRIRIPCHTVVYGRDVYGFRLGSYDPHRPVVIDPQLEWATFLGGADEDVAWRVRVDPSDGDVIVVGETESTDFPGSAPEGNLDPRMIKSPVSDDPDIFVSKLSSDGSNLWWTTYLGATGADGARAMDVDSTGNIYIAGYTSGPNFPVTPDAPFKSHGGGTNGQNDKDVDGLVRINTSCTYGVNAPAQSRHDFFDAFVAKLAPDGASLLFGTYLGGLADDVAWGVKGDGGGNIYVGGVTRTGSSQYPNTFPIKGALFQDSYGGGKCDGFIAKLHPVGPTGVPDDSLVWSTYFGRNADDTVYDLQLDSMDNIYVTGSSESLPGSTQDARRVVAAGSDGAYVAKFSSTGAPVWISRLPGGAATSLALREVSGHVYSYVTGVAGEPLYNLRANRIGPGMTPGNTSGPFYQHITEPVGANSGSIGIFVQKLNPSGTELLYSTYFASGGGYDFGYSIAVDSWGNAYVTGSVQNSQFPTTSGADDTVLNAGREMPLMKFDDAGNLIYSTFIGDSSRVTPPSAGENAGYYVGIDGWYIYLAGVTNNPERVGSTPG